MIVYLVINQKNGKRYVGCTKRTLDERWKQHIRDSKRPDDFLPFHRAIQKHGEGSFRIELIESCQTIEEMKAREVFWISKHNTCHGIGYNATEGGDGVVGYVWTGEARKKLSESRIGEKNHNFGKIWAPNKGTDNPMFGKHHSDEARQRISSSQFKSVVQYDLKGNEVARYSSMLEAEEKTGIARQGISRCCRFPHRTAQNFRFMYAEMEKGS